MIPGLRQLIPLFLAAICPVAGAASPQSLVVDFPVSAEVDVPSWMRSAPFEWEDFGVRRIEVPLSPLDGDHLLVATIIFQEKENRGVRVLWIGEGEIGRELAPKLQEGIAGWNQRTVLLPADLAASAGNLVIESEGGTRIVHRIAIEILRRSSAFVPPARSDEPMVARGGEFAKLEEIDSFGSAPPPDAWFGNMIEAWLQEYPESIGEAVEFAVEIRPAPRRAILRFEINGRGAAPTVFANGKEVGRAHVEAPSLRDPAYLDDAGSFFYAGWRKGWVFLPAEFLREGDNSFAFLGADAGDWVKGAKVELWFDRPVAPSLRPEVDEAGILDGLESLPLPPDESLPANWNPELPLPTSPATSPSQFFRTSFR